MVLAGSTEVSAPVAVDEMVDHELAGNFACEPQTVR